MYLEITLESGPNSVHHGVVQPVRKAQSDSELLTLFFLYLTERGKSLSWRGGTSIESVVT